jgi:hypothetical protein
MECPYCGKEIESQQRRAARARWAKRGGNPFGVRRRKRAATETDKEPESGPKEMNVVMERFLKNEGKKGRR